MLKMPKIVGMRVGRHLWKYEGHSIVHEARMQAHQLVNDREVVVLLLWAVISPAFALAFLLWTKYRALRVLAIPLFVLSIFQFWSQWAGVITIIERLGVG